MRMRQVIKHRDIRLLNMIRRTDPVIHIYLYRLEEVVSTETDTVEQIETELVAACNIFHPSVVVVETIADVRSQRYLVRYAEGDSRDYEYAELVEVAL